VPPPPAQLTAENLAEGLRALISNPEYTRNAACIGEALRNEHGCANAADLIVLLASTQETV